MNIIRGLILRIGGRAPSNPKSRHTASASLLWVALGFSAPTSAYWCLTGGLYSGVFNLGVSSIVVEGSTTENMCVRYTEYYVISCVGVPIGNPNIGTFTTAVRIPECAIA